MNQNELDAFGARYAAAWSSNDPQQLAACYDENGWLKVNDHAKCEGRPAIAAEAQGFMTSIPNMQVSCQRMIGTSSGAIFEWSLVSTTTKGNQVAANGREILTFSAQGRIATSLGSFDTADFMSRLAAAS